MVADVRAFLQPLGVEIRELSTDTSTALLAAQALGTSVASIVKSLLFVANESPILVLVAGDRKVNVRRLESILGVGKARLATPDEVIGATGFAVGGVPPVAHATTLRVLMDRYLLDHETVYAAAGAQNAIFAITPGRLVAIAGAQVADVAD